MTNEPRHGQRHTVACSIDRDEAPVPVSAQTSSGRLLARERAWMHLRPAVPAELGDVVLEPALAGPGDDLLIETHR